MKKYISILICATAVVVQSCERTDAELSPTESPQFAAEVPSEHKSGDLTQENPDPIDGGDDDEPRRDKQHWKIAIDSAR